MRGLGRTVVPLCLLALGAGLLSACGSDDGNGGGGAGNPLTSDTGLTDLLDRFVVTDDDDGIQVDFSADAQLRTVVDPDADYAEDAWASSVNTGASNLFSAGPDVLDTLAIDLEAAEATITVGVPPETLGLVVGGQDADAVTKAAEAAGWTDDDGTLTTELMPDEPLSLQVPQLRPDGADVLYGAQEAELSRIDGDGTTLAEHPLLSSLTACLDDALAATIVINDDMAVAVGAAYDSDDPARPRSIICAAAESDDAAEDTRAAMQEAVESGESLQSAQPFSEYFSDPETEVLDEQVPVAKLLAVNANGRPAYVVRQMLAANDLPGLQAEDPMMTPSDPTD